MLIIKNFNLISVQSWTYLGCSIYSLNETCSAAFQIKAPEQNLLDSPDALRNSSVRLSNEL